ncbi:unnamed protein product [Citrullus colocynthis]|uniref:Uncharacterized protein n=1 Tax=Citrullus colocynthis TaxID=252529 RepID=A0ABP0Z189_9ROSI
MGIVFPNFPSNLFVFSVLRAVSTSEMLRRQPSKIEVKIEDKEELEQARKRAATTTATDATTAAASLLHNINRNKDQTSKAQRLGISS